VRILVLGATGGFGRRIALALAGDPAATVIAAARTPHDLAALGSAAGGKRLRTIALDVDALDARKLAELDPLVVIDTVGPFQGRDFDRPRLCIAQRRHYVDLSDARDDVPRISSLHLEAREAGVLAVSGASTVPALSSAVVEHFLRDGRCPVQIDIGISPGFRGPRGLATVRSILSYVGRPIPQWRNGGAAITQGWGDNVRHRYPSPVGARSLAAVDVPDTLLLPARYPTLRTLTVRAGLEVSVVHHGLRLLGACVRRRWLENLARHAQTLLSLSRAFDVLGSDCGAMHVSVRRDDGTLRTWTLVAERGDGPQIPATAAIVLARRLCGTAGYAPMTQRGAMPAHGLLDLAEFEREWVSFAIRTISSDL
jgi:hypothetical protein